MARELATTESSELELHRNADSDEFATFYIGKQMFGIPILKVQDILTTDRIAPIPLSPKSVHGSINLRGRIVTVIDVHTCLGLPPLDVKAIDIGMPVSAPVLYTEIQKKLVQTSFDKVAPDADAFALNFYDRLFEGHPEVKSMFPGDMKEQRQKLVSMLKAAVKGLDKPESLKGILVGLGERHVSYGVKSDHYDFVGQALLSALEQALGADFTAEVKEAWTAVYTFLAREMQAAKGADSRSAAKAQSHTGVTVEKDHDLYTLLVDKIGDVIVVDDSIYESNPGTLDPKWREYTLGVYRLEKEILVILDVDKLLDSNS